MSALYMMYTEFVSELFVFVATAGSGVVVPNV